jgi:hypothetical protein
MAIAAVETELADMMLVAEGDGLSHGLPDACQESGAKECGSHYRYEHEHGQQAPEHEAGNAIGASWKDLRHDLPERSLCRLFDGSKVNVQRGRKFRLPYPLSTWQRR